MNNNVSFGSTPLYKVNVLRNGKPVKAVVSLLSPQDKADVEAMEYIKQTWEDSFYSNAIVTDFTLNAKSSSTRSSFFALEIPSMFSKLGNKIVAIAEGLDSPLGNYTVEFIKAKKPQGGEHKGLGEVLMYGVSKFAHKVKKRSELKVQDDNPAFYDAIKMPYAYWEEGYRVFEGKDLTNFLSRVEKKYKFKG